MQGMDPKDGLPLHNKLEDARHLAQRKQWVEAEKMLLEVVAATPRNVSALNVLGLVAFKIGDADKAAAYYQKSLPIHHDQFRVYGCLGTIAPTRRPLQPASRDR